MGWVEDGASDFCLVFILVGEGLIYLRRIMYAGSRFIHVCAKVSWMPFEPDVYGVDLLAGWPIFGGKVSWRFLGAMC